MSIRLLLPVLGSDTACPHIHHSDRDRLLCGKGSTDPSDPGSPPQCNPPLAARRAGEEQPHPVRGGPGLPARGAVESPQNRLPRAPRHLCERLRPHWRAAPIAARPAQKGSALSEPRPQVRVPHTWRGACSWRAAGESRATVTCVAAGGAADAAAQGALRELEQGGADGRRWGCPRCGLPPQL